MSNAPKLCGNCWHWKATYMNAGVCRALVGRTDVPYWAPDSPSACRHLGDGRDCPVFFAKPVMLKGDAV